MPSENQFQLILRRSQVQERTGLPRSTLYSLVNTGKFPSSIRLSDRAVGWLAHEVEEWISTKVKSSRVKGVTQANEKVLP